MMGFLKKKGKPEDVSPGVQRSNTMPSPRQTRPQQATLNASPQPHALPRGPNFQPVVLSVRDQEWVHQRILLIYGRAGPDVPFEGQIMVDHHNNSFPPQSFPVTDSHYKVLAHLIPGPNNIKLTFIPPPEIARARFTTRFTVHYLPLLQNPPLHLAIVLARDSDGTFEGPIDRTTGLDEAVKRLRVASLLWQAYTVEQLYRNFPPPPAHIESARRSFRLEEEWMEDTLSLQEADVWRSSTKIHVVRSELSVDEIRREASISGGRGVKAIVRDALLLYGSPFGVGDSYAGPIPTVLCLLLDPRELMGRDRVNPTDPKLRLSVFISRTLWSWPTTIEEVVPSLQDDTQIVPTSPGTGQQGYSYYGSPFEAASAGLGGMLREMGYAFGCVPEEAGSTIRNLQTFHRTFLTHEGQISRSQLQGLRPCLPAHESSWHRLDCVQFRYNQCFRLPAEPPVAPDEVVYWPCENGIIVSAPSGIILILIRVPGKTFPVGWFEYPDRPEHEVFIFESDITNRIPEDQRIPDQEVYLEAISAGGGRVRMNWQRIMKEGRTRIPQHSTEIFESRMVGKGQTAGSQNMGYFIFNSPLLTSGLINLRISHARALYSIEFRYADGMTLAFGQPHPQSKQTDIPLDPDAGEMITGFAVRAGEWVDAIKVITNMKESSWLGDDRNTRTFQMTPPQGYEIIGICGQIGICCDAFGVVYTSNT